MEGSTTRQDLSGNRRVDRFKTLFGALTILLAATAGCQSPKGFRFSERTIPPTEVATDIEVPEAHAEVSPEVLHAPAPQTALSTGEIQYWPLKLEEAMQIALNNSRVMRDLGGRVLSMPMNTKSVLDPAIAESDPLRGPEAALSAFDAAVNTNLFWMHGDQDFTTGLLGGLSSHSQQDIGVFQAQVGKTAATGAQFYLKNTTLYGKNSLLLDIDGYYTNFAAGFSQPLLQGNGIEFNRIAGPNARPGQYNGVLIARINTDITLADFEAGVRDLLFEVEQSYWQLYRAYRDLDARTTARQAALETWQIVQRKLDSGKADREQESHARQQYYAFDAQVVNSMTGMTPPTYAGAANSPTVPGVLTLERRLRWLLGLPPSDGRLIRPAETPMDVRVVFDWNESLQDALTRRVELRRQRWVIKRKELELIAARNFLRSRLDLTGEYAVGGLGIDMTGNELIEDLAGEDLLSGDTQNWQLGLQWSTPIGNRIGHTAVRNAELQLTRERAIYQEQELRAVHDLSDAVANVDRSYAIARASFNGFIAAHQQLEEVRKKYDAGLVPLDFLLDARRRAVEADSAFYQAASDYSISVANVYFARGTLLAYDNVFLSEGPWSEEAHQSAIRQSRRFGPRLLNYVYEAPPAISRGSYAQVAACPPQQEPTEAAATAAQVSDGPVQNFSSPEPAVDRIDQRVQQIHLQEPMVPESITRASGLQQPSMSRVDAPVQRTALQESIVPSGSWQDVGMRPAGTFPRETPVESNGSESPAAEGVTTQRPSASSPVSVERVETSGLRQPSISRSEKPVSRGNLQQPASPAKPVQGPRLQQPGIILR